MYSEPSCHKDGSLYCLIVFGLEPSNVNNLANQDFGKLSGSMRMLRLCTNAGRVEAWTGGVIAHAFLKRTPRLWNKVSRKEWLAIPTQDNGLALRHTTTMSTVMQNALAAI